MDDIWVEDSIQHGTDGQLGDGEGDDAEQEADGILGQEDGASAIVDANVGCREAAIGETYVLSCQFRIENQQGDSPSTMQSASCRE